MRRHMVACSIALASALAVSPWSAAPVSAAPVQRDSAVYVVRAGDSLIGIAAKLKVRLPALLAANNLRLDSLIWPGMRLTVPASGPTASTSTAAPLTYTVRPGDALIAIAARAGVKVSDLLAANGLRLNSVVHPGRVLTLPTGARPISPAPPTPVAAAASRAQTVVDFALAQRGKPYRFNAAGPDAYDCSGLVRAAFATIGVRLPHQSALQARYGRRVDWLAEPILPGDLVFTRSSASDAAIGHVGIAVTATTWVQAPQSNDIVRSGPMPVKSRIVEVRRIVQP